MNHHEPIFRKQTIKFCGFSAGTAPEHWEHPPSVALDPDTVKNGSETRHSKRVQLLYWWDKSAINGGFNGEKSSKNRGFNGKKHRTKWGMSHCQVATSWFGTTYVQASRSETNLFDVRPNIVGGTLTLTHMIPVNSSNNNNNNQQQQQQQQQQPQHQIIIIIINIIIIIILSFPVLLLIIVRGCDWKGGLNKVQ